MGTTQGSECNYVETRVHRRTDCWRFWSNWRGAGGLFLGDSLWSGGLRGGVTVCILLRPLPPLSWWLLLQPRKAPPRFSPSGWTRPHSAQPTRRERRSAPGFRIACVTCNTPRNAKERSGFSQPNISQAQLTPQSVFR